MNILGLNLYDPTSGLNLVIKTPGNACNLNCEYCFEKMKNVSNYFVTADLLKRTIDKITFPLSVVFHGGEPLIVGIDQFRSLLEEVRKYYPTKVIAVNIQTNGTMITQEWIDLFFKEYEDLQIEIALSLDGTEDMNRLRKDNNNDMTFKKVIQAFRLLERNKISAGMLSVMSRDSLVSYSEYIDFLKSIENIRFVKINALFNFESGQLTKESITPSEYADFIINVSEAYVKAGLFNKFPLEPFLSIIQRIKNKPSKYCNYSPRKCFNYICLYPNGIISPCDCLSVDDFSISTDDSIALNSSIEEYVQSGKCYELRKLIEICSDCDIQEFCMGGCLSQRYYFRNNEDFTKDFCIAKHRLYNHFKKMLEKRK